MAVWIVATAIMIAAGRGNYGIAAAYASRYKLYADLLSIYAYDFLSERLFLKYGPSRPSAVFYKIALAVSIAFCLRSDLYAWRYLTQRDADLSTGLAAYRANPMENSPMYISDPVVEKLERSEDEAARRILNDSISTRIYSPPATP